MNKLLPLALSLALAGCSLAPEFQRPVAPVPAAWSGGSVTVAPLADEAPDAPWRAVFADPGLQAAIGLALANNRDLRIAVARVEEARAQAGIARADRLPTLDVNAQRQAARTPGDLAVSGRPTVTQRADLNLGIAAFELDFWGRVRSLEDAARASFLATDYARQAFRLSLIADVANAWLSRVELDERLRLARATAESRAETRQLVAQRRDLGLAGDLDYLAADAAWQGARAELASLGRQLAAADNALRLLVGTLPGVAPAARPSAATALIQPPVAGLPSEVLLQRPDVLAAEERLRAANASIGAARAAFFPRIGLTALAGVASRELGGLFDGGSGAWSFVPVLKWPLFDAGRTAAGLDLAEARREIAVADYERTVQQAFRETADLLAARAHYAEQLLALEAALAAQDERLDRVTQRHRAGVSSYLELLDAQREQFAAQQAVLAVWRAREATGAGLFKALAGATAIP